MISRDNVKQIASLARIHLQDQEITALTKDLEGILQYVDKLSKLDVAKVQPTTHVAPLKNVLRKDDIKPSLKTSSALEIAVEHHEGSFKVPKVIE